MGPLQFKIPEIRPATLADAAILDTLLAASTRFVVHGFVGPLPAPLPIGHLASTDRMLVSDGTAFLVEASGTPLAFGAWSRRDRGLGSVGPGGGARLLDPATEPARVLALAVRADFAGKGLAAGILDECAAAARAEGFRALALMAREEAVTMCIRCGFREISRLILDVGGTQTEAVEMTLRLRP